MLSSKILLVAERMENGVFLITSPELPLFVLIEENDTNFQRTILLLMEFIFRNYHVTVRLIEMPNPTNLKIDGRASIILFTL